MFDDNLIEKEIGKVEISTMFASLIVNNKRSIRADLFHLSNLLEINIDIDSCCITFVERLDR